ncbi:MAG: helix-turn-helix transcriptional regulator [Actinocatenispora sp.]
MVSDVRMTVPVARVLAVFLDDPAADRYGTQLMEASGLASGSLYPILTRLRKAGWAEARWEDIDPVAAGRPARRYYRLTPEGASRASAALDALHRQTRFPGVNPAW